MASEVVKGHVDTLVLSVLDRAPAHGYALVEELKTRSDGTFDLAEGTVYPSLYRLERGGLVSSGWESVSGRRRRVYRLTRRGQAALIERRDAWRRFSNAMEAVLA